MQETTQGGIVGEKPQAILTMGAAMTTPVCDCPEACGCYAEGYAQGKDKAYSK